MRVSAKRLAALIGVFLLLLAVVTPLVVLWLRQSLVNSTPVRKQIAAQVLEYTGRRLQLAGEIDVDEFPWIQLVIGRGQLENPVGFAGAPLLSWNEVRLRVHYSSLYSASPLLGPIVISGLKINLQRDLQGRDNWSDLGPLVESGAPTAPLEIPGIELPGLTLRYIDQSIAEQPLVELADIRLDLKNIHRGAGAIEGTRWRVDSVELKGLGTARIAGSGTPNGILSQQTITRIDNIETRLAAGLPPTLAIERMTFRFGALQTDINQLAWAPPALTGRIALRPVALDVLLRTVGIAPPFASTPDLLQLRQLSGEVRVDSETLQIRGLNAQIDDTRIRGELTLGEPIDLALDLDALDVDRYAAVLEADPSGRTDPAKQPAFPGRLLQGLPLAGSVRLGEVRSRGTLLSGVTLRLESGRSATARTADKPARAQADSQPAR